MTQPPGPAYPEPQYPGAPQYSGTPPYPGAATPGPQYPGTGTPPPAYPSAAAPPPQYPATAPAYPDTAPRYPAAPAHPGASGAAPQDPSAPPRPAPFVPPQPAAAPDDLDYRHQGSRIHVAAHQRGADATAIGRLAVQIPGFLVSLAVVTAIARTLFAWPVAWLIILAWLASGALVFHRPAERVFARRVLKLRPPLERERARLEPIWREVTARAGVEAHTYELMVENSEDLNAVAAAGHLVGVTTYALNEVPTSNLAAVLAHELGHHAGGHSWAGLLGYWYSLPGRMAWALIRRLALAALWIAGLFSTGAFVILALFMGIFLVAGMLTIPYITIPLLVGPYLLAYAGRRGELRADQHAAALGFAPKLAEVLHHFQYQEDTAKAHAAATGQQLKEPGALARLLSTHPGNYERLRALEPYLAPDR
ncbi:M48 family metalloprotease [Streptomyces sp. NPDC058251]|uniref:M48 family metalloprotease n=1 Tax=Streptomyces sp. NPDC058251 TaxID=3346404 RepID=UPI0036EDFEE6